MDRGTSLTLDDFFTGLIAGLASLGVRVISIRGELFHEAIENVFRELQNEAVNERLRLKFTIARNPIHGDSPDVREALVKAVQRDIVSLDNPTYQDMRLKIGRNEAEDYLARVPGSPALYLHLAEAFLDRYPAYR